jgi:hypothetical protein
MLRAAFRTKRPSARHTPATKNRHNASPRPSTKTKNQFHLISLTGAFFYQRQVHESSDVHRKTSMDFIQRQQSNKPPEIMNLLKYITTSIAIACLSAIFAGCGGSANTPEGVVKKQINATKKWDVEALAAIRDLDESQSKHFMETYAFFPEERKKAMMTMAGHVKIVSSEIKGDEAIVVTLVPKKSGDGFDFKKLEEHKVHLVNKNEKWLIQDKAGRP